MPQKNVSCTCPLDVSNQSSTSNPAPPFHILHPSSSSDQPTDHHIKMLDAKRRSSRISTSQHIHPKKIWTRQWEMSVGEINLGIG
jgi:hypothetical protein